MLQVITKIVKWSSIPVLLMSSMLSRFAGSYELPVDLVIWLGAFFLAARAVRSGDYVWAAGLGVVVIVFSPLLPGDKTLLFMGYTGIATFLTLAAVFGPQPLAAAEV
ncbi:MAG: hypothetical protein JWP63_537 [Candidatus Solibacter sp.]|jgi:hypothetical protein|nr:hypothetical protein [Candidatus Solibacter sp.]